MKTKILCLMLVLSGVAAAQVPDWYTSHTDASYPPEEFIIGVGSGSGGNGIESAKKAALVDIVSQIRVQVQSEMKDVTQSFQMNKDEQIYSDFRNQTRTVVSGEISGAEIAETYIDQSTNTAYALAVVNRKTYSETIGSELANGWKQASDLRSAAKDYLSKGRLVEAIQSIQQARKVVAPLMARQVLYDAVARSAFQSQLSFNPNVLQEDIRNLLSRVKVEIVGGNRQTGKIGAIFPQPLAVRVSVENGDSSVPCSGVPVEFLYDHDISLGQAITDEHGQAELVTTVRPVRGDGIEARLAISRLGRNFENNITASSANFTWTSLPSDRRFVLSVTGKDGKIAGAVRAKFSDAITEAGYSVAPAAAYLLSVDVQKGNTGKVEGFSGTIYTVKLIVIATLTERKSSRVLGSASFAAQGVGESSNEATMKAAESLMLDMKEMGELLDK